MRQQILAGVPLLASTLLLAGCGGAATTGGGGEEYPTENIRVIIPYAAGGPTDAAARATAPCLEETLETTIVVENKPGGGGAVGAAELASVEADGYTLGILSPATVAIAPFESAGAGFAPDDFQHIGTISEIASGFMVPTDSPFDTADDLFEAARADPGSVSVSTGGASTTYSIELQRLVDEFGIPLQIVPFEGGAPAEAAMLGKNVDGMLAAMTTGRVEGMEAGDLKVLFTGAPEPVEYLPDVPTLASLGYPELVNTTEFWTLSGPLGMPDEVANVLTNALEDCLQQEGVTSILGEGYVADEFIDGQETAAKFDDMVEAFEPIVNSSN